MAKQRNSLGICVLPVLHGGSPISWDEYKERYGVDLEKIFEVVDISGDPDDPMYEVAFKTSFSKIIVLSFDKYSTQEVPSVSAPTTFGINQNADKTQAYTVLSVIYGDMDGGYNFRINADKTVTGGGI